VFTSTDHKKINPHFSQRLIFSPHFSQRLILGYFFVANGS